MTLDRATAIRTVADHAGADAVIVATTGYTGRALLACGDHPRNLYVAGSMGCASSIALGIALNAPSACVYCLDGDGAALMRLEALVSIGRYRPAKFFHVLLDNNAHESTGAQPTLSDGVNFAAVARAVGYRTADDCASQAELRAWLTGTSSTIGPHFLRVPILLAGKSAPLPRPSQPLATLAQRFAAHLQGIRGR